VKAETLSLKAKFGPVQIVGRVPAPATCSHTTTTRIDPLHDSAYRADPLHDSVQSPLHPDTETREGQTWPHIAHWHSKPIQPSRALRGGHGVGPPSEPEIWDPGFWLTAFGRETARGTSSSQPDPEQATGPCSPQLHPGHPPLRSSQQVRSIQTYTNSPSNVPAGAPSWQCDT